MSTERIRKIIGPKNFGSDSFALLAVVLFAAIVLMSVYFIADASGNSEAVLGLLDKFQLRDKFLEIFDKFNTAKSRNFNQGYFAFSIVSFVFLLLFAPKKAKGNVSLYTLYAVCTLAFVVYFALVAMFPEASIPELWNLAPQLFEKPFNEILDTFLINTEFFIAVISVCVFAVNVMIASANRNFSNFVMSEEHAELKKRLIDFPSISSKSVKKLVLRPTYWGLFFIFMAQVVLPVLFLDNSIMIGRARLITIVASPLLNWLLFGMSANKARASYRMKNVNILNEISKQIAEQSATASKLVSTEQPVANQFNDDYNKSMFWMREAKFWHSQAHHDECFENHYASIMNDVPKNKK